MAFLAPNSSIENGFSQGVKEFHLVNLEPWTTLPGVVGQNAVEDSSKHFVQKRRLDFISNYQCPNEMHGHRMWKKLDIKGLMLLNRRTESVK